MVEEEDRLARLEEEENNPMKALENRTVDAKREMDILDALQDIKARNARNNRVGQGVDLVARVTAGEVESEEDRQRKLEEEEDEILVRQVFSKVSMPAPPGLSSVASGSGDSSNGESSSHTVVVKRKADDVEPDIHTLISELTRNSAGTKSTSMSATKKPKSDLKNKLGIKVAKKAKVAV